MNPAAFPRGRARLRAVYSAALVMSTAGGSGLSPSGGVRLRIYAPGEGTRRAGSD